MSKPPPPAPPGLDFGWKAHAAIQDWTRSVDTKASIALTLETAVSVVAARELVSPKGQFAHATGFKLFVAIAIGTLLGGAILAVLKVVFPRLARRKAKQHYLDGLIYFGHLRRRSSADIAVALDRLDNPRMLMQLADQLHVTSQIAWRKHASLQVSTILFGLGVAALLYGLLAY